MFHFGPSCNSFIYSKNLLSCTMLSSPMLSAIFKHVPTISQSESILPSSLPKTLLCPGTNLDASSGEPHSQGIRISGSQGIRMHLRRFWESTSIVIRFWHEHVIVSPVWLLTILLVSGSYGANQNNFLASLIGELVIKALANWDFWFDNDISR